LKVHRVFDESHAASNGVLAVSGSLSVVLIKAP
jgi:hypothetical protein